MFVKSVRDKIKQSTEEAFEKQLSLMRSAEHDFVQLNASKEILDRAGLKPPDKVDIGGTGIPIEIKINHVRPDIKDD